jgi:hypothetical protein
MNKVLMVVTSYRPKSDRIYHGADEWRDGWGFSNQENYKLRTRDMARPVAVKSLSELASLASREETIIWIRGSEPKSFPNAEIGDLVTSLRKTSEVYFAYHDEFVGDRIASAMGGARNQFHPYSLSLGANPDGFKAIIKTDRRGENHLNPEAKFDDIFGSFFLDPTDVFALVMHKVPGTLSVIDLDLQIYEAAEFHPKAWKQLADMYQGGRARERLQECQCVFYKNPLSLKQLYERESLSMPPKERSVLDDNWVRLTELFPDDQPSKRPSTRVDSLYLEVEKVIVGLDLGVEASVRKNFEEGNLFRSWMDSLEAAVRAIREVVMANRTEPVGV